MLSAPRSPTRGSRLLVSSRGRPAGAPRRLSLATVLQFSENLSDRRAAEAARGRIDWEYLLGLDCVAETLRATRDAVADPGWRRTGTEETWSVRDVKPADDLYVPGG